MNPKPISGEKMRIDVYLKHNTGKKKKTLLKRCYSEKEKNEVVKKLLDSGMLVRDDIDEDVRVA